MRKKIGELLVEAGAATADDVKLALGNQRSWGAGQRLGQVLVHMGTVSHEQVARALALQFDLPFVDLPQIPSAVSSLVPLDFQSQHRIVPFRLEVEGRTERLHLAVADPSSLDLVDELRFQLGKPVKVFVAAQNEIDETLAALNGDIEVEVDALDMEEEHGELQVERAGQSAVVPGGWFATGPHSDSPFDAGPPAPATAPAPAEPAASAGPALPVEWDFAGLEVPAKPTADLDDLLGGASAVQAPLSGSQPLTRPALPPPASPRQAEVLKFQKAPGPAAPATPPEPPARTLTPGGTPIFGGAAAPDAPRVSGSSPATVGGTSISGGQPAPAAAPADAPTPPVGTPAPIDFSDEDLAILEDLGRLAAGQEASSDSAKVKPAQMVATLIRLLMKKGVIAETEFLEELARK